MTSLTEREIASKYTGSFAWPTVLLFLALVTGYGTVAVWGVSGVLPMWICMLINGVLAYGFYTIHHESNHKNISGRYSQFRWIDHLLGNIAAIPLHLNFVAYAPSHLQHHAHTNDPDRDPDSFMAGPGKAIFPRWVVSTIVKTLLSIPGVNKLLPLVLPEPLSTTAREFTTKRKGMMYYNQACLGVLVLSFVFGIGSEVLMLWWLPAQIGALILQVWFVWLPHHDFSQTSRYKNTRIRGWWGSTIMLLGQDHHLIHHLYPRVPFYNYRKLYKEISASLVENGATIQMPSFKM
jgi:beta-carotene hydroxylase